MTAPGAPAEARLPAPPGWAELARGPRALFLDVDGTLLEFEAHPDLVRATDSLVSLLESVSDALSGALAVISGRPLHDLDRVFAPWVPYGAGIHGLEVRDATGEHRHRPDATTTDRLRVGAAALVASVPGTWLEDKGASLAVHHRENPQAGPELQQRLARLLADDADFELLQGVCVVELRPRSHDKGTAVDELMAHPPFAGRVPVVVGDDTTDEDAFLAAERLGGLAVVVGPRTPTVATHRLPDPASVRGWLAQLLEEVRS